MLERQTSVPLEEEMRKSYLDYAMSVIVGRALQDIRDGLKPVHRGVLYAMSDLGLAFNRPYKKAARVVGEVLGKYHPHGDATVYEALVRMVHEFSLRYPFSRRAGQFRLHRRRPAALGVLVTYSRSGAVTLGALDLVLLWHFRWRCPLSLATAAAPGSFWTRIFTVFDASADVSAAQSAEIRWTLVQRSKHLEDGRRLAQIGIPRVGVRTLQERFEQTARRDYCDRLWSLVVLDHPIQRLLGAST